jgi:hypothetical protein
MIPFIAPLSAPIVQHLHALRKGMYGCPTLAAYLFLRLEPALSVIEGVG